MLYVKTLYSLRCLISLILSLNLSFDFNFTFTLSRTFSSLTPFMSRTESSCCRGSKLLSFKYSYKFASAFRQLSNLLSFFLSLSLSFSFSFSFLNWLLLLIFVYFAFLISLSCLFHQGKLVSN